MYSLLLSLVLVLPCPTPSGILQRSGEVAWNISRPAASKPPIVEWLTERDHDFGQLRQERASSFIFKFKNIHSGPILLQTVRTSCGCTAATWTETPIAPGAEGQIEIEYDAYQRGSFSKKIRVFFDRQRKAEILWIRGEVK